MVVATTKPKGAFDYKLAVTTNDPQTPRSVVACIGKVNQPLAMDVRDVLFGRIPSSSGALERTLEIRRGDGGPLALRLDPFEHPNIEASLSELEPGEHYQLHVRLSPPWPEEPMVRAVLRLQTGVPEAPRELITVHATIAQRLAVMPPYLRIPARDGEERMARTQLVWSGGEPARILELRSSDPNMRASVETLYDHDYVVLKVPADYLPPSRPQPTVTLTIDDPEMPTLEIPVHAVPDRRPR